MQKSKGKQPTKKAVKQPKSGKKRARDGSSISRGPAVSNPVPMTNTYVKVVKQDKDQASFKIRQPFTSIANVAGATEGNCSVNTTLATQIGNGQFPLCPQNINGVVQNEAQFYSEFRLDSVLFHYTPTCPTTTSGALVFAFNEQVATNSGADVTTFALARSLKRCVTVSVYEPKSFSLQLNLADKEFRICEGTTTGGAVDKLLYNWLVITKMDQAAVAVTTINYGYLDIELGFTLRGLVPNQGIAMFVDDRRQLAVMKEIKDRLFPRTKAEPALPEEEFDVRLLLMDKLQLVPSPSVSVKSWQTAGSR